MLRKKSLFFIASISLMTALPIIADEKTENKSTLLEYACNNYLTTMFGEEKTIETTPIDINQLSFVEKFQYNINQKYDTKKQTLTPRDAQKIAFDLVTTRSSFATTIVDRSVIDKLEIISSNGNQEQSLLNTISSYINTKMGKAHILLTLCHPTAHIVTLKNRQNAIKYISQNRSLINACNTSFKKIARSESISLQAWHSKLSIDEIFLNTLYFPLFKTLNTNTVALETYNRFLSFLQIIYGTIGYPIVNVGSQYFIHNLLGDKISLKEAAQMWWQTIISPDIPLKIKCLMHATFPLQLLYTYQSAMSLKSTNEASHHLQNELIATTNHINSLKTLSTFVNKNRQLVSLLPSLKPLADFNNPKKRSASLNKLLGMLDTNTFKGKPSSWSVTGRVLAAHKLMQQVKDELAPVFTAAGELEMYVALAQLYNERKGTDAEYCMAQFLESNTPVIEAHGFWNPFINPEIVVTNDVLFNSEYPNSILTGPNTGGKSTVIKGVMLDVLMAQTFGIAPAHSLILTPFAKLNCFMNIADDIATGASLFKSEVMRAKELSAMVSSLEADEFSFVIIDEVFTGTSPQEGEMAAVRFGQHLATFPNSIAVIATHYPKMTTLEDITNGKFYNHHVEILRNEDGSLNRTFKLKSGPTFVNVAFDILKEEGLVI